MQTLWIILLVAYHNVFLCSSSKSSRRVEQQHEAVSWDPTSGKCVPDVCKGNNLNEIIGFDKKISVDLLNHINIYDSKKLAACLHNRYMVMLGDSTLKETFNAIVYILSGLGTNQTLIRQYAEKMLPTKGKYDHANDKRTLHRTKVPGFPSVVVENVGREGYATRNVTATVASQGIKIRYRFNGGGRSLAKTGGGIISMIQDGMTELRCLLGAFPSAGCAVPKIVVYQSAHQDLGHWESSMEILPAIFEELDAAEDRGARAYWRSSLGGADSSQAAIIEYTNLAARFECRSRGTRFIDIGVAATLFDKFHNSSLMIDSHNLRNTTHASSARRGAHLDITYESWMTQYFINQICNNP